jgi:hypothetical protein
MPRSLSYAHSSAVRAGDGDLVIRPARPADSDALAVLAALDSARPLRGERVVVEADGGLVAAISLDDGRAVADPFVPSAGAVEMLRLHAAASRGAARRARRRLPRLAPHGLAPKIA